jgi:hypothetical protein
MTTMSPTLRIAAAGALALALAACGEKAKPDPYLQNIPDAAALTIDTSASASASLTAVAAAAVDPSTIPSGGSAGNDLAVVHQKAQQLNEAVRHVFAQIDALTASGGQVLTGNVKQWGPAVRCVEPDGAGGCVADGQAKLVLRARRWTDHLGDFVVLATSVSGTNADYRPVLAGYLIRGAMDRRGAGKLWVNQENLHEAAPGFKGRGYAAAGFAAGPVAKRVTFRMLTFTRDVTDPAGHPVITAAFTAWKNGAGVVRARVAAFANLDLDTAAQELGIWRAVWAASAGGRAYTVVTDARNPNAGGAVTGDVDPARYWFARACYAAGATTPSYKEWFSCDKLVAGLPNPPRACVLANAGHGTVDPLVPSSFTTWQQTTCYVDPSVEPDELRPPTIEPRDADDDRDEDGADHAGLMPEPVPTTASGIMTPDQTPPGMSGPGMGGMM